MSCKVVLIPEAEKDYKKLDGSIIKLVNKKIEELSKKPFVGKRNKEEIYRIIGKRLSQQ